jgi:hypothetical protein
VLGRRGKVMRILGTQIIFATFGTPSALRAAPPRRGARERGIEQGATRAGCREPFPVKSGGFAALRPQFKVPLSDHYIHDVNQLISLAKPADFGPDISGSGPTSITYITINVQMSRKSF